MRNAFLNTLVQQAEKDQNIFLITNDLGFSVLEPFEEKFPDRYLNIGVAEANMIGVAAGLALSGKKVFVYSIVPFITMRCFEQIRNDICSANLSVVLVGVGGGLSYGTAGLTHHSLNDIAIMRTLSNMTVLCPGDPAETRAALMSLKAHEGPVYLRLGKGNDPVVHDSVPNFTIGKAIPITDGQDITLIATGNMLYDAKETTRILNEAGLSCRLLSMPSVKPIDEEAILNAAKETKAIFTIEEHSIIGGLGGAVAEFLGEHSASKILFRRIGFPDQFCKEIGSQKYLREKNGLSPVAMANYIAKEYKSKI